MRDILTITMNPAVDITTSTATIAPTHKIRCGASQRHPGGGGINVARVVQRMGGDCAALFPAGGSSGEVLKRLLDEENITQLCVPIAGETRESFSVKESSSSNEYRFVLPGPDLAPAEWQACLDLVARLQPCPHYVVASGSLPPGVPTDFYARLAKLVHANGGKLVLDTSGPALAAALEEGVYLVKPSLRELRELVGQPLETQALWRKAALALVDRGRAQVVVLSLGEGGAWLVTPDETCFAPGLPVQVVSTIGAGDSFVGGMVWALCQGLPVRESFRYGVAAASAAVLSVGTGLCSQPDVIRLHDDVTLEC
jgi:6-phosphofructokinase 2